MARSIQGSASAPFVGRILLAPRPVCPPAVPRRPRRCHPSTPRGAEALAKSLWVLGALAGAIGLYYVVLAPGESDTSLLGRDLVDLHRLALGMTFTSASAVFLAAAAVVTAVNRHLEVTAQMAARGFAFYLEDREPRTADPTPG